MTNHGQPWVERRARLASLAVVCAFLALGALRGGWHASGAATHPAQATQHLFGHGSNGSGGLAEGGGPPGHKRA